MINETYKTQYIRTSNVLYRQLSRYIISYILIGISISLGNFINGIVVSNLLGRDALSVVNLALPFMLFSSTVGLMLGTGGSMLYGEAIGANDRKRAAQIFTVTILSAIVFSLVIGSIGVVFSKEFAGVLGGTKGIFSNELAQSIRVLSISIPFVVPTLILQNFLNVQGNPGVALCMGIIGNIISIPITFFLILRMGMGPESSFLSSGLGYFVSITIYFVLVLQKKVTFQLVRIERDFFLLFLKIVTGGSAEALSQILFSIQFSVLNILCVNTGDVNGIAVFAVCTATYNLIEMLYSGIGEILPVFLPVLSGAKDYSGKSFIIKRIFALGAVFTLTFFLILTLAPQFIFRIYSFPQELLELGASSMRIYALGMVLTCFSYLCLIYLQALKLIKFALLVSILRTVAFSLPLAYLLSRAWGFFGIFWSYSLSGALVMISLLICATMLSKKDSNRFSGILLLPRDQDPSYKYEMSIPFEENAGIDVSKEIFHQLTDAGIVKKTALLVSLAIEEMVMLTIKHKNHKSGKTIDILITLEASDTTIIFRMLGDRFNVIELESEELEELSISNFVMLQKISKSVQFERLLMMNSVTIAI